MKFTIEEEKRGDKVTRVIATAVMPERMRIELSFSADERRYLEEIVTACNAHDQLLTALKEIHRVAATAKGVETSTLMAIVDMADSALTAAVAA